MYEKRRVTVSKDFIEYRDLRSKIYEGEKNDRTPKERVDWEFPEYYLGKEDQNSEHILNENQKIGNVYVDTWHPKYKKVDFKYITLDGIATISESVKPNLGTSNGCDTIALWRYTKGGRSKQCWNRELRVGDVVEFEVVAYIPANEVRRRVVKGNKKWQLKLNTNEQKNKKVVSLYH